MKIHDVFHVSLLSKVKKDTIEGREVEPAPPVVVEGEEQYEVEEILSSRWNRNNLQYLVKWVDYGEEENSWEPAENVQNSAFAVSEYHRRYPEAASPTHHPALPGRRCKRRTS